MVTLRRSRSLSASVPTRLIATYTLATAAATQQQRPASVNTVSHTPLVLCIASDEAVGRLLCDLLMADGLAAELVTAPPGRLAAAAAEALTRWQPPVAIMTMGYPYQREWARFVQLRDAFADCAFIIATIDHDVRDEAAKEAPETPVLAMPLDVTALLATVRRALGRTGDGCSD